MDLAFPLTITSLLISVGFVKVVRPQWLLDTEAEREAGRPTAKALAESRWQGIVMLGFGLVALYAILTWDGTPAEFIGV